MADPPDADAGSPGSTPPDGSGAEGPATAPPTPDAALGRTDGRRRGSRAGLVAIVVGGLLLVALVLVVTQREPVALPPDSPEATVQAWLQSLVDGDPATNLLDNSDCGPPADAFVEDQRLRASVNETSVDGDTAVVELEITESYGMGVFDDGYSRDETYDLRRTPDGWRITAFSWPWDSCWNGQLPGEG